MPEHTHIGRVPRPECTCRDCHEEMMAARAGVANIDAGGYTSRDHVRVTHHEEIRDVARYLRHA